MGNSTAEPLEKLKTAVGKRNRALPAPEIRRAIRIASGATQQDLADAVGVTRPAITRYEAGIREPRGELRHRYADLLEGLRGGSV